MFSLIKLSIKFSVAFIISFFILSINISGKSLFYYIKSEVGPARLIASSQIKKIAKEGENTVRKIFAPSSKSDQIDRKDSARQKK